MVSTLVRKVASISETTITVTLGQLIVVNKDDGHDAVTSKTTEKEADLDVVKHTSKIEAVARSSRSVWTPRPQRFRRLQMDTTRADERKTLATATADLEQENMRVHKTLTTS